MNIRKYALGLLAGLMVSTSIAANRSTDAYREGLNPLDSSYIHDLVHNTRWMKHYSSTLPKSTHPVLLRVGASTQNVNFPIELSAYSPWLVITGYGEPFLEGQPSAQDLLDTAGFNAIIHYTIKKVPFYIRAGLDRTPFGRHASEIMMASQMVTQQLLNQKGITVGVGFSYALGSDQALDASISLSAPGSLFSEQQEGFVRSNRDKANDRLAQQEKDVRASLSNDYNYDRRSLAFEAERSGLKELYATALKELKVKEIKLRAPYELNQENLDKEKSALDTEYNEMNKPLQQIQEPLKEEAIQERDTRREEICTRLNQIKAEQQKIWIKLDNHPELHKINEKRENILQTRDKALKTVQQEEDQLLQRIEEDPKLQEIQKKKREERKRFNKYLSQDDALNTIINIRYQKSSPTQLAKLMTLDCFTLGLGLGLDKNISPLFNFNSDIDFAQYYNFKFEYLYHGTLNLFGLGSALHTELSRRFSSKLPLVGWNLLSAGVFGYELGYRPWGYRDMRRENNLLLAGKFQLWKERITLVLGGQWSLQDQKPQGLIRLNVQLL
jgi:hypothetical protein